MKQDYEGLYKVEHRVIDDKATLILFSRTKDGTKKVEYVTDFKPYCYVNDELLKDKKFKLPEYAFFKKGDFVDIYGKKVYKLEFPSEKYKKFFNSYVRDFQGFVDKNTYELDIHPEQRFMIDRVDKIKTTNYKIVSFDIETTTDHGFPKNENPIEYITCITAHDNYSDEYQVFVWRSDLEIKVKKMDNKIINYYNKEEDMLNAFLDYLKRVDCDILTAWNIKFDIEYTYARMKRLGIDTDKLCSQNINLVPVVHNGFNYNGVVEPTRSTACSIQIYGTVIADAFGMYKQLHFGELDSYSLDSVANVELGDMKLPVHDMSKVWRENLDELIFYNIKDVELVVRIVEKCKLIALFEQIRCFAGVNNINDCSYMSRIHDTKILRKYFGQKVFPTKPEFVPRTEENKLQGAYVYSNPGLYDNVVFFDYSGLYPNIIKTFNLSKEKKSSDGLLVNDEINVRTNHDSQGIMSSVIDDLFQLKKDLKDQMKNTGGQDLRDKMFAIKIVINSIWGVFASSSFRLNDLDLANTVTYNGRRLIQKARDIVKEHTDYVHVMSDTDSIGFVIPKELDPIEEGKRLQKIINDEIEKYIVEELGMPKNYIFMEFEKVAEKAFIQTKKRYVLKTTWEDGEKVPAKIKACGMQMRRSDTAPMSKTLQKDLFKILLDGNAFEDINKHVDQIINDMLSKKISVDDVAIPTKLNKPIEKYTITRINKDGESITKQATRPVIRGVQWSNSNIGTNFREGNKFKLIYIKDNTSDVMCFEDEHQLNQTDVKIDWVKMINKNVYQKAKPIYDVLHRLDELDIIIKKAELKLSGQQTLI